MVVPRWWTSALALVVAIAGAAAVVVYRYLDVGALGPFPDMYEPVWYPKKVQGVWAEGASAVAALALLAAIVSRKLRARQETGHLLEHAAGRSSPTVNHGGLMAVQREGHRGRTTSDTGRRRLSKVTRWTRRREARSWRRG